MSSWVIYVDVDLNVDVNVNKDVKNVLD